MIGTGGIRNRVLSILGSALILMFFSEFFFVNEGPVNTVMSLRSAPVPALIGLVETTAFYALAAWAFLLLLPAARRWGLAGIFLAACLFGWITEGAIVPVVHEAPPVSWIWTSVSWHAPIDVLLGLFVLRHVLNTARLGVSVVVHILTGIGWGVWSTWTWSDPDALHLSGTEFLFFATITTLIWVLGLVLMSHAQDWTAVTPERWGVFLFVWILGLVWAYLFLPFSIGPLTLSAAALWLILRPRGPSGPPRPCPNLPAGAFPLHRLWHVGLVPVMATGVVWLCESSKWKLPTEDITALFFVAGTGALLWAYWRVFTIR